MWRPPAAWATRPRRKQVNRQKIVTDPTVSIDGGTGTSTGLLQRAAQRQADAWDKLVSLYGPLVYRWCRRWGLQPKDAENIGQDVFLRVWQGLGTFRREANRGSFRGWLYRITRNRFLDHLREQKKSIQPDGGSAALARLQELADDAEERELAETSREDESILYRKAIDLIRSEFSDRDWDAFAHVVLLGRRPADVAAVMNISTNIVYLAKSRVLRRLREEFGDLIDF